MSWIKDKINTFIIKRALVKVVDYLRGKKTAIGAVSLLLWVAIYAIPAFTPDYNFIVEYAKMIRDALMAGGINIDNELFNAGVGFTVVGLIDKITLWYRGYKTEVVKKDKEEK